MRILINHMTRMHGGHICLAGVDLDSRRHVRPMLANEPLPFYFLARVVDLGAPRHTPDPPHVEDYVFVQSRARVVRPAAAQEFWKLLQEVQRPSLHEIFGPQLQELGHGHWGTGLGQGLSSLGVLRPAAPPELYLVPGRDGNQRIRMRFTDGRMHVEAGVTDLRLYAHDHATPDPARLRTAIQRIHDSPVQEILLGVGLTRKYRISPRHDYHHWLQVNNIHFKEDPTWPLG